MNRHGSTAIAQVQNRPVLRGRISRAVDPNEANADASAILEVPTLADAKEEWFFTPSIWASRFAGNSISLRPNLAAITSPSLAHRSSVATTEPGAISIAQLSIRSIRS
jgi:hypothetical protein